MAADAGPLAGKVVMISGATGDLGGALVRFVRAQGARTAIAVRRPWQVDKVSAVLGSAVLGSAGVGSADLLVGCVPPADGEAAAGFVKGAADALGPIDALLCSNGAFRGSMIGKDPNEELQELIEANLLAGASLARAVVGPMKRRRTGSLVFVGSAAVGRAGASAANYLASKAALHEWVRALAFELRDTGVRAAAVLPTTIDTDKNRAAMTGQDRASWQPLDVVVQWMVDVAFAPSAPGPLYPIPISG